jgi:protoporphyrinogen oxidase
MESVRTLIVGAGISGLATAAALGDEDYLVLEADTEIGGYCKTVKREGFVWDYSGHFFHFKHPEIEAWLRERMPGQPIRTVDKRSFIRYAGRDVDFPFQKNIHQLPRDEFIDCLVDLYESAHGPDDDDDDGAHASFARMLYARFGRGIAERFLIPYNEKLYACDLDELDVDAMGRFFPHADIADIVHNMRHPDNTSYNASFTYPLGGAIQYIHALLRDLPDDAVSYGERLVAIDFPARIATTTRRRIRYQQLVSSAPLNRLATATGIEHDAAAFSWNKVLVFNLGFDRKGPKQPHWIYFPDRELRFYRVGFYDNIMDGPKMSLYVEIGAGSDARLDVEAERARVLADLTRVGIVDGHELVSWHSVVLDPAYVHVTQRSLAETARLREILAAGGVYSVGRYGRWTYCSIEDNIIETRELARVLVEGLPPTPAVLG